MFWDQQCKALKWVAKAASLMASLNVGWPWQTSVNY